MFRKLCLSLAGCVLLGAAIVQPHALAQAQSLAISSSDPSPQQVYAAARAGNLALAQQMIDTVLRDHPDSANAHYVAAEVYARSGNLSRARSEFSQAQTLAPGLPFANASSVTQLQQQLSGRRILYGTPLVRQSSGISWGAILLVLAVVAIAFMLLRRRSVAARYAQPYGSAAPGVYPNVNPYGPGPYGPGPYGAVPGTGSGLMGSLATGLAVGAGVAAGEQLVQHVLGAGSAPGSVIPAAEAGEPGMPNADMGGNDFGLNDASSWDSGGGGDPGGGDMGGGSDWT